MSSVPPAHVSSVPIPTPIVPPASAIACACALRGTLRVLQIARRALIAFWICRRVETPQPSEGTEQRSATAGLEQKVSRRRRRHLARARLRVAARAALLRCVASSVHAGPNLGCSSSIMPARASLPPAQISALRRGLQAPPPRKITCCAEAGTGLDAGRLSVLAVYERFGSF